LYGNDSNCWADHSAHGDQVPRPAIAAEKQTTAFLDTSRVTRKSMRLELSSTDASSIKRQLRTVRFLPTSHGRESETIMENKKAGPFTCVNSPLRKPTQEGDTEVSRSRHPQFLFDRGSRREQSGTTRKASDAPTTCAIGTAYQAQAKRYRGGRGDRRRQVRSWGLNRSRHLNDDRSTQSQEGRDRDLKMWEDFVMKVNSSKRNMGVFSKARTDV
jgi:hypothetical protein